jgi:hypothetical protein
MLFAVASACVLAVGALGCGGGGGTDEVTAASISKAQYIKEASAVCEATVKRMKTDFGVFLKTHEGKTGSDEAESNELIATVLAPNVEREVEELRELGAPENDVKTVEKMLRLREETVTLAEEDPEAVFTNEPFEKSINAAKKYGLAACAVP